jgi:hypothetical protein
MSQKLTGQQKEVIREWISDISYHLEIVKQIVDTNNNVDTLPEKVECLKEDVEFLNDDVKEIVVGCYA